MELRGMKDSDRLIINLCHALRHNVKFSFSSMTLQSISGRGSMSRARGLLCICASIQLELNRPRLACCQSENPLQPHPLTFFFFFAVPLLLIKTSC